MDLDVMASVQENIIGNCLCVLGDSMAMPVGSMIKHFRPEFEAHMEQAARRQRGESTVTLMPEPATGSPSPSTAARCARPRASGCVDAVKRGDVEVPFFCYEPKLGPPVGACRMCLVEIEGIPKLQTSCSTPVKDGMVVYTQTDRVKHAQNAVVEFLLVNHPLDCPVCDKGGECPLQDISLRLGPGPQPLRRAQAQLPEADRAVAAGRDRPRALHPLLPLRALLAGGRRGLPARVPRARRPHLRRDLRRPALRRAVLGQHHRALPGGRAHQHLLPVPRAALGHRGRRLGLHALPEPVQHRLHGPRRAGRARARPRQRRGRRRLAVRQGPLGLPVDRRRRSGSLEPLVRDGGHLRPATLGAGARRRPSKGCARPALRPPRSPATATTNEEGYLLQRIFREALGSRNVDSRAGGSARAGDSARLLSHPRSGRAPSPTSTAPRSCSCSRPTRSTRRRSSTCGCARRCAASARGWWSPSRARPRSTAARRSGPALRARSRGGAPAGAPEGAARDRERRRGTE